MKRINQLKNIVNIASSKGNYNVNEYMLGMANGLILALAIMENKDVQYLTMPYTKKAPKAKK